MWYGVVGKETHYLHQSVVRLDAGKEICRELCRSGFTLLQSYNINKFNCCVDSTFRREDFGTLVKARVRNFHNRMMRLGFSQRRRVKMCFRDCLEQR